jgi:hypothetical protein
MTDPKDTKRQTVYLPSAEMHDQVKWLAGIAGNSTNGMYVQMIREGIARRLSQPTPDITVEQVERLR